MMWTAKLYPEDGNLCPIVRVENVVRYEIMTSIDTEYGRRKKYVTLYFDKGQGHLTVLFDTNVCKEYISYRRLELFNKFGNMVVAHGNNFDPRCRPALNHNGRYPK